APPPPARAPAAPPSPAEPAAVAGLAPAADGLARQAEQQRQTGDYAGAAATLERSLRIAPREPYLWNRLARVRMEQGLTAQAGQLAARSNDYAGGQAGLKKDNWRIIAEAKRRNGDVAGATEAEQRAGGN
ncbi:tetratricopeptide repeat protein, partial [uncultured Thiodictyon sp.]|uniref:tetratricopeptide repeat protein n=2 Tax=uncultured Thiodictyon sp. TaxID=1846217 RepID=UPI0025F9C158